MGELSRHRPSLQSETMIVRASKIPGLNRGRIKRVVVAPRFEAMALLLIPLFALLISACSPTVRQPSPPARPEDPLVLSVVDGDTITVLFSTGQEETVRLLGIDTPETVDPSRPVQCFGPEASAHLADVLPPGTPLLLERDLEARDRFGRLLSYVHRADDGLFVNAEMLRGGFADLSIFEPNVAYRAVLTAAATSARTGSLGLWEACGGPDVPLHPDEYD